jgi:hypothetical protein
VRVQLTTMLVGEGAKLDVHGCKTVDMASSFGKVRARVRTLTAPARPIALGVRLRPWGMCACAAAAGSAIPRAARADRGGRLRVRGAAHQQALLEFVFIVFACITLLIGINAAKSKAAGRVLFPATFVTGIASISYFSMASGGGWVIAPDCRQLFVARYMDWLITTPLLLIDLGIVAGVSRWDIMALCLSDSACPAPCCVPRSSPPALAPALPSSLPRQTLFPQRSSTLRTRGQAGSTRAWLGAQPWSSRRCIALRGVHGR